MTRKFLPGKARHDGWRDHLQFIALGLGTIYEGLVMTLSLGYLTVDTRAWLLFDAFEED